jgi:protein-S-isoprenylcysteine O-methyltransferase Ste14
LRQPGAPLQRAIGAAGALLFAASLGYFLFSYAVTFGEITAGVMAPGTVATNVTLFSVFALHHSLFARERVRAAVARLVSPAYERTVYVAVASLMLIAVCALWRPVAGVAWRVPSPGGWMLHAVQAFGVWLSVRSAALLDIRELAGIHPATAAPAEFRTDGPYGWIRHPIYLGWFLIVFAVGTMTLTRLVFALVSGGYVLLGLHLEERALRRASGGRYDDYARKVPYKLVPGIY